MDVAKHTKYYQGGHMKDSKYYVGMDVHKAATVITVLNSAGKQIMKSIVETKANTHVRQDKAKYIKKEQIK